MMSLNNILHPNRYHGFVAKAPFFEGWCYKLVSADEKYRFAVIPGVFLAENHQESHSFVQVFDSNYNLVRFHRYPYDSFKASPDSVTIILGPNYFSSERIELAIDDDLGQIEGTLSCNHLAPWPVNLFSPGAMGWFAWVPFMECYHGVVGMDHTIAGHLQMDGDTMDFSGGWGYIEKDWGKRFPSAWIWGQTDHFDKEGISMMVSVAVITWLGRSFAGFIVSFLFAGEIHRFATYNRSKTEEIQLDDNSVHLTFKNKSHRLRIKATRDEGGLLQAPTEIATDRRILETLNAIISVQFESLDGQIPYQGDGKHAGLETVGDLDQLIMMISGKSEKQ